MKKWYHVQKGFTMVELMVVIIIIGILSSFANYQTSRAIQRAKETQLKAMVRNITNDLYEVLHSYDLKHRWGKNYDEKYLNGKLQTILENKPYDNVYGHKNPYSGSKLILNWRSVPGKLRNPAVFITMSGRYYYDKIKPTQVIKELRGSVVVWMRNKIPKVELFYIDMNGRKSGFRIAIED